MNSLPIVEPLVPAPDPVETAARFRDHPYLLFLDSAAQDRGTGSAESLGRYSFLMADPAYVVRSKGALVERRPSPGGAWTAVAGDALSVMRSELAPFATESLPGLPPFQGGVAGYVGYDWGATLERLPPTRYDDLAISDVILGLYDWVIAWDHRTGEAWIISTGVPDAGPARAARAQHRLQMVRSRIADLSRMGRGGAGFSGPGPGGAGGSPAVASGATPAATFAPTYPVLGVHGAGPIGLRSTFTHRGYLNAIARVREYILAGDIFQANLSQRFQAELREPPFDLYQRLRRLNPAPFAAYLQFDDVTVLSASPERFLRLDGRHVETRPIKGTRPRGLGPMHDAALGRALTESDKDRAENLMIVDLLRNDLSRLCLAGTVRVPELFALEQHPTVHHLVSTVVGELAPGADAMALLAAAFPGGSITGAPKVRAMEIIAELEPTQRAIYCGSIGYISLTGAMDTSIVIRSYLALRRQVYFQAGGGIVADSDPELEYRETLDKARGLIEALQP